MLTRVAPVTTWFDRIAADVLGPSVFPTAAPARGPRTSARSTDAGLELRVELPGVAEEDIEISVDGRVLTVTAARVEGGQRWSTSRSLTVGEGFDVDATRAHYQHGLLTLVVPPQQPTARRIAITPAPAPVAPVDAVESAPAGEALGQPADDAAAPGHDAA